MQKLGPDVSVVKSNLEEFGMKYSKNCYAFWNLCSILLILCSKLLGYPVKFVPWIRHHAVHCITVHLVNIQHMPRLVRVWAKFNWPARISQGLESSSTAWPANPGALSPWLARAISTCGWLPVHLSLAIPPTGCLLQGGHHSCSCFAGLFSRNSNWLEH